MSEPTIRTMPGTLAALPLVLALSWVGCSDSTAPNTFLAKEAFSFSFDATAKLLLTLEAENGLITITGVPGGTQLSVQGERSVGSNSPTDAEQYLDSLRVVIDENPEDFVITTEGPSSPGSRTFTVDYEIELPDGLEIVIASGNGDITVAGMNGDIVIASGNGNVTLADIEASAVLALGNGNVDAEVTLPPGGNLELAVGNGLLAVAIPQSTSADFAAEVGNGSITIINLALTDETITPTMVTGRLGAGDGTINLSSGNGDIGVTGF